MNESAIDPYCLWKVTVIGTRQECDWYLDQCLYGKVSPPCKTKNFILLIDDDKIQRIKSADPSPQNYWTRSRLFKSIKCKIASKNDASIFENLERFPEPVTIIATNMTNQDGKLEHFLNLSMSSRHYNANLIYLICNHKYISYRIFLDTRIALAVAKHQSYLGERGYSFSLEHCNTVLSNREYNIDSHISITDLTPFFDFHIHHQSKIGRLLSTFILDELTKIARLFILWDDNSSLSN